MRVKFNLGPNHTRLVPFDYHSQLVGRIHHWLGENTLHDDISLYSLSELAHTGQALKEGLFFPNGTFFHLSSASDDLLANLIVGLQKDTEVNWGMRVESIMPQAEPTFKETAYFIMQSPVLIKRKEENGNLKFFYYDNPASSEFLTATMQSKMKRAGVEGSLELRFDTSYSNPKIKMRTYRGIKNKASLCPVIATGDPHCLAFAWNVGIGNSTGIGFGAIK
ncbi:MAG: CRISPR-associated endoribonuclease Cas6 [Bacteroidota bacterium]